MILKKLLKLAFLLKGVQNVNTLFSEVNGQKVFLAEKAIGLLTDDLIEKICTILTDEKPANEIDALAGITDFFLQFKKQAADSPNLKKLAKQLPLGGDLQTILSWIIGKD